MNALIKAALDTGFIDLGFAEWLPMKGLQIKNLEKLDQSASGVYIMHFDNKIQKIGKSSASLYRRLKGYARFDSDSLAHPETGSDKTSQRQRRAIAEAGLSGLYVLALQPDRTLRDFNMLQIKVQAFSFDAHSFEEKLIERARADASNNPLKFGR